MTKYYKSLIYSLFILTLFVLACQKDETTVDEELYHEYFPVNVGHSVIYEVDSIVHDDFTGTVDTFYYQIKEYFESTFIDDSGKETIRLERYIRNDENEDWDIKNVWMARRITSRAEKVEENIRYIKLAFPLRINKRWNGNAYNFKEEQTYTITDLHHSYSINDLNFDSVATVLQKDEKTLISEKYQTEKYAKNIGLIYKEYIDLKKDVDGSIISGIDYRYKVIDYKTHDN